MLIKASQHQNMPGFFSIIISYTTYLVNVSYVFYTTTKLCAHTAIQKCKHTFLFCKNSKFETLRKFWILLKWTQKNQKQRKTEHRKWKGTHCWYTCLWWVLNKSIFRSPPPCKTAKQILCKFKKFISWKSATLPNSWN